MSRCVTSNATMARGGRRVDEALSAPQAGKAENGARGSALLVPATAGRAPHFGASRPHTSV